MYDARAVSNFLLDRAGREGISLTLLTLLKVLYFAHAWHLAKFGEPLVAQPFEAWQHGPVNRVVYEQYKGHGKRSIEKPAVSFNPVTLTYEPTPFSFDKETERFLTNVFDYYVKFHPFTLVDLTHEEGGPWHIIWEQAQDRAVPGMVIPNNLILEWFQRSKAANVVRAKN